MDRSRVSKTGYCYIVEDGSDGYCIHAPECSSVGQSWSGPNFDCIRFNSNNRRHVVRPFCDCGHPGSGCTCR